MSSRTLFRRLQHDDAKRYAVYVLWLIGYSQRAIAGVLGLRTKQVAGIIHNSEYRDRAAMTDAQRAGHLAELREIRIEGGQKLDRGLLDRVAFAIRPLDTRQARGPLARKLRRAA